MGIIYLIHFKTPLAHAHHYVGFCEDNNLSKRINRHRAGNGSKLMRAVKAAGIAWDVVRVWEGVDRAFERKIKNYKKARLFCPLCRTERPVYNLKVTDRENS